MALRMAGMMSGSERPLLPWSWRMARKPFPKMQPAAPVIDRVLAQRLTGPLVPMYFFE